MIANAVSAILGQRLLRVLCPECKVRYRPTPEELRRVNLPPEKVKSFYRPPKPGERAGEGNGRGGEEPEACEHCGSKGYFGRTGIFELLVVSDRMRDLIRDNPDINAIRAEAVKTGMKYLFEEGLWHVLQGNTSLTELLRVCK
jgi:type II secretory ATPase GspE/PulE/Tfp pilus assembly ATPase PilB-like protein